LVLPAVATARNRICEMLRAIQFYRDACLGAEQVPRVRCDERRASAAGLPGEQHIIGADRFPDRDIDWIRATVHVIGKFRRER